MFSDELVARREPRAAASTAPTCNVYAAALLKKRFPLEESTKAEIPLEFSAALSCEIGVIGGDTAASAAHRCRHRSSCRAGT